MYQLLPAPSRNWHVSGKSRSWSYHTETPPRVQTFNTFDATLRTLWRPLLLYRHPSNSVQSSNHRVSPTAVCWSMLGTPWNT